MAKTLNTEHFTIGIHKGGLHGWFEHNTLGDECGGGLWFDPDGTLYDYDGVYRIPLEVLEALKANGFNTESMEEDHVDTE
jgi:hypothetical protein